jgi:hypothetical protein
MSEIRYDTLVNRVRALLEEGPAGISSEAEADAEMNLPDRELVEGLSVVLGPRTASVPR